MRKLSKKELQKQEDKSELSRLFGFRKSGELAKKEFLKVAKKVPKKKVEKRKKEIKEFLRRRVPFVAVVAAILLSYYNLVYSKQFHKGDCVMYDKEKIQQLLYPEMQKEQIAFSEIFLSVCGGSIFKISDTSDGKVFFEYNECIVPEKDMNTMKYSMKKVRCE